MRWALRGAAAAWGVTALTYFLGFTPALWLPGLVLAFALSSLTVAHGVAFMTRVMVVSEEAPAVTAGPAVTVQFSPERRGFLTKSAGAGFAALAMVFFGRTETAEAAGSKTWCLYKVKRVLNPDCVNLALGTIILFPYQSRAGGCPTPRTCTFKWSAFSCTAELECFGWCTEGDANCNYNNKVTRYKCA